ncbi:MAG: hypothetical protein ABIT38_22295 [Gemmatimonadaceae bacterium]
MEAARGIILQVLRETENVSPDPQADVILVDFAESSIVLRARWWTKSRIADGLSAQDRVLTRTKRDITEAGIDLPFPTHQILFHDQTEVTDGDGTRQREGWPPARGVCPKR